MPVTRPGRESAMRIGAFHIAGNGAAQSVDLKISPGTVKTSSKIPGNARPNVVDSFVISGAGVLKINWTLLSIIPGQGFL